ncbi:hydrolethalus syndrome protein 1 homolog [Aethina tumida]|uniref:hydrolethalus syndrome protein 1 homolog n=1 Tax=Aethina tumida TaxID=116153 RepID=UPI00096B3B9E|nr:hydrolethalus syndrome protein 1 homolog [Aethina tumida]
MCKMCDKIDPKIVLMHLNELGFTNINALQLKEFIKDLKKLLKYEKRRMLEENSSDEENVEPGRVETYKSHTHSSRARQKESQITVQISKSNIPKQICHPHCKHVTETQDVNWVDSKQPDKKEPVKTNLNQVQSAEESIKSVPPNSLDNVPADKPASTNFIKAEKHSLRSNKSDPVSLYHQYKDIWSRTVIPGTTSRSDLRWAIRERMLSGPKVDIPKKTTKKKPEWR